MTTRRYYLSQSVNVHTYEEGFYVKTIARSFKINQSIATFLGLLTIPKTAQELVEELQALTNCPSQETIKPLVTKFLSDMYRLEIIRREGDTDIESLIQHYQVGAQLGTYQITALLSLDDQFVQVYQATCHLDSQPVVLKMFSHTPAGIGNNKTLAKGLRQFQQEFSIMRSLATHPSICKFYEYYETPYPYAVLEYLPGDTLSKKLENNSIAPEIKPLIARQMLESLAHVHKNGIIHGDIHPRNFIVEGNRATLIDFGFSYRYGVSEEDQLINRGGAVKYLAPERINQHHYKFSKQAADFRAEVYQIGLVLFKLYYGPLPFEGFTWLELAASITNYDFSKQLNTSAPHDQVLLQALRRKPEERYASACELLAAWQQAMPTSANILALAT